MKADLNKKNSYCRSQDYDFYIIPFPFAALRTERRNKYIYSELSKLHPCFCDDCCFDSRLRIERTGLKADVVVMQKYRLAEYKSQNKKICIGERKRTVFFGNSKTRRLSWLGLVLAMCLVVGLCGFYKKTKTGEVVDEVLDKTVLAQANIQSQVFAVEQNTASAILLLEEISQLKGECLSYNWKSDGFVNQMALELSGIFPEQLVYDSDSTKISSVSFKDDTPFMNIVIEEKNTGNNLFVSTDNSLYKTEFRKLVTDQGGSISSETVNPYGISFTLQEEKSLQQLLNFILEKNMSVQELSIAVQKNELSVQVCFSEVYLDYSKQMCNALRDNLNIFFVQRNLPVQNTEVTKPQKITPAKKVGRLIKADGSFVDYYKDENGRITRSR